MTTCALQAVVFDFDGVIVDTEYLHYKALNRVLQPLGLGFSWDDYVDEYIGFDDRGVFQAVYRHAHLPMIEQEIRGLVERKAATFHHMVSSEPPEPFPGAVGLIRALAGRLPLGLCTGALRTDLAPIFKTLKLEQAFDVVVTADDVRASKPDPACYRLAVKRLGECHGREFDPKACLAIEDTPTGIEAAKGARLKVLALTNSYDRDFLGLADFVYDTLEGLTLEELQRIVA